MEYYTTLSGSPIVPYELILSYEFFLLMICISAVYVFIKNRNLYRIHFLKSYSIGLIFSHLYITSIFSFFVIFYLVPAPKLLSINSTDASSVFTSSLEILFDKPVQRSRLEKSISPPIAGIWKFADPIYDTHLYKKLIFTPLFALRPATTYTIQLSQVSNFAQLHPPLSYKRIFTTPDEFPVLGSEVINGEKDRVRIIGSFPQDGTNGLAVDTIVKIRFNRNVYQNAAESKFSIIPHMTGSFSWDSDTLMFFPDVYLAFDTRYTFFLASGVTGPEAKESIDGYAASFTTQPDSTQLAVPQYLQKYALSCEAAALRMTLAYRGVRVTEDELLSKIGSDPTGKNGNKWGNPYVGFVGNVKGAQMKSGYGVYWDPIARAANHYRYATSFENGTVPILTQWIQKSTPVIVWISIRGRTPEMWMTPSGDRIVSVPDEHTVVITGFLGPPNNPSHIIVNDPLSGELTWPVDEFEKKWNSLGKSGVVVL